ncbi:Helix-turn-helix domain-containing protein [Pseudooceanicola antarcticus]|uniref:AraC family transcriptional regulator n=1 Tax=Pseudooceanicola antarcticus TaxID=1247613 RepID=A0A285JDZ1_9RHOB|nr:AraC family transcriptional regulator [Pseudooceanicola antarcticus]PJE31107.1 AraC family transcriptional regulator [Pseudooceanicola antarcticus]SNY58510.1 Helix-turn-helix domain-containing protein [Pseudooceanicola antarcticus]
MENAALLTLAGLCLGVALSGLLTVVPRQEPWRASQSLGLVYLAFMGLVALPLVRTFAGGALLSYMPLLLVLLLAMPPAFHHYILARTSTGPASPVPWRDLALPVAGGVVCIGYWLLPAQARETMFLSGELPPGVLPAALALATFVLILLWLVVSLAYVVASLRRLAIYRREIRQLYSDADARDLRWVDVMIVLILLIWAAGAGFLADENLADGSLFVAELFLVLVAAGLLVLNVFAPVTVLDMNVTVHEEEPELKYARSALTGDHAAKLAARIEAAMRNDALYLDPSLSLQKLSRHVGALPNQVSQTLNQEIGESFFDFVAKWRIEASKPMILAGEASVLSVALEVGFNSRSTFYKAFKRETGMTPKDYRLKHRKAA